MPSGSRKCRPWSRALDADTSPGVAGPTETESGLTDEERAAARAGVAYKGAPLDAEKGPGLGCFWFQAIVLVIVVFLAPLSAAWNWPIPITIVLFALMLVLLLFVGQTVIFLLRLVAADRRAEGRRRPMRSGTKTVGEIEDETSDQIEDETPGVQE